MKKTITLLMCCFVFVMPGCLKDKHTRTYTLFIPIYKDKNEVFANIKSNAPREIGAPGKIFIYGDYIFMNEVDKGVHVIDNSNPGKPIEKAFIDIPGNIDIAVKGNTLYADIYSDLVTVDITNPLQAKFVKYIPDVFPERNYTNGFMADNQRYITGWIKKDTTVDVVPYGILYTDGLMLASSSTATPQTKAVSVPGISGSMARFVLVNNYLYAVDRHTLKTLSLANAFEPKVSSTINAGWDIETIYPFKNKLFLGSMVGMFMFDITDPAKPVQQSNFTHARACDPVIADDKFAYITLREGTTCGPAQNELDIVSIADLGSTTLLKTYPMNNPRGLSKDNNLLFICDGKDGIKMYDATDPLNIVLKKHITGIETYDAIAWNNNLIVVTTDGLYQYDYSNSNDLIFRSKLTVNH